MKSFLFAITGVDTAPLPKAAANAETMQTMINIVLGVVGSAAILIIVLAGIRYITSQGDPQGVSQSKKAIIYALAGLAVCIFAQIITSYVLESV